MDYFFERIIYMDNIIYLDDYINLYNKKLNKIIIIKPYKDTLYNGVISNRKKFIKLYNKILDKYKLKNNFINENITIIINNLYTEENKLQIKEIMEELYYKKIYFIQETNYLIINKKRLYINYNNSYFYLIYINGDGKVKYSLYKNDYINRNLIIKILSYLNKEDIIIYGKNVLELESILNKNNINYFVYEESENMLMKLLLKSKNM